MKRDSFKARTKKHLDKRFVAYTLAAAGVAATAKPVKAEVVYIPANLTLNQGLYPIDLNGDGSPDFVLNNYLVPYSSSTYAGILKIQGGKGVSAASVMGARNGNSLSAWDAPLNFPIGESSPKSFVNVTHRHARMVSAGGQCCQNPIGQWKNATNRFLGFKFTLSDGVHYGWARMTVTTTFDVVHATLTGYAYETTPGKTILAGDRGTKEVSANSSTNAQQPSLGLLSAGAQALDVWRRGAAKF